MNELLELEENNMMGQSEPDYVETNVYNARGGKTIANEVAAKLDKKITPKSSPKKFNP